MVLWIARYLVIDIWQLTSQGLRVSRMQMIYPAEISPFGAMAASHPPFGVWVMLAEECPYLRLREHGERSLADGGMLPHSAPLIA